MRKRTVAWLASVGLLAAACSAPPTGESVDQTHASIVGGMETAPCAWPNTVHYQLDLGGGTSAGCTATLVHPKMITVADHCLEGNGKMELAIGDTDDHSKDRRIPITSCTPRPAGVNGGEDFAFCILSQEVTDIPIIP